MKVYGKYGSDILAVFDTAYLIPKSLVIFNVLLTTFLCYLLHFNSTCFRDGESQWKTHTLLTLQ